MNEQQQWQQQALAAAASAPCIYTYVQRVKHEQLLCVLHASDIATLQFVVFGFFSLLLPILWQSWKPITIIIATLSAVNGKCFWSCDFCFFVPFCSVFVWDVRDADNDTQNICHGFVTWKSLSISNSGKIVLQQPKIALAPFRFSFLLLLLFLLLPFLVNSRRATFTCTYGSNRSFYRVHNFQLMRPR